MKSALKSSAARENSSKPSTSISRVIDVEQLNKLQEQIAQYESTIQKNASDMAQLCDELSQLKCVIFLYETQIADVTNTVTTKDQTIASRDADIEQLKIILAGKEAELAHLRR